MAAARNLRQPRLWRERLLIAASGLAALVVTAGLGAILWDLIAKGVGQLGLEFFVEEPRDAGRAGGIAPMLLATLWTMLTCLLIAVPLGFGAAAWLATATSTTSRTGRALQRCLDILAATPSIVFGLFGNALFCEVLGFGYSILSGGLTLACMVLPIIIRTAETGLRAVPNELRRGAAALALGPATTLFRIMVPAAAPALLAGVVLGLGRALAETAALIFTSGVVDRSPASLLDSGRVLSVHIFELAMHVPGGEANAAATALVLVIALILIECAAVIALRRLLRPGTSANVDSIS